jgi:hypothetical protein
MVQNQQEQSGFNQRADKAAMELKGDISQKQGLDLQSKQVAVGPDGKPPPPLPPEGSYMRETIEQQRAAAQIGDQPPAGTAEQMLDGSQAPPMTPPPSQQEPQGDPAISQKAQDRFSELSAKLRSQEQALQAAKEEARTASESKADLEQRLAALEQTHQQMVQSNLDNLDPEARMLVMQQAQMQEGFQRLRKDIVDEIMPHVQGLEKQSENQEMMALGNVFPAFDIQIHGPLVEMYRGKNPHSTIEQAFKAIATPQELVTRETAVANLAPPIVQPGSGTMQPRYMPEPQANPDDELRAEARALHEMARSDDPAVKRELARRQNAHLAKRLGGMLPGS